MSQKNKYKENNDDNNPAPTPDPKPDEVEEAGPLTTPWGVGKEE